MKNRIIGVLAVVFIFVSGLSWAISPAQLFNQPFTSGNAFVTYPNGSVKLETWDANSYAYVSSVTYPATPNYTTRLSIDASSNQPRVFNGYDPSGCYDGKPQCPVYWTNAYLTIQWLNSSYQEFGRIKYDLHNQQSHYDLYVIAPSTAQYFQFSVVLNPPGDTHPLSGDSILTITNADYSLNYSYNPGRVVFDNGSIRFGVQTLNGSAVDYVADSHAPSNNYVASSPGQDIQTAIYWLNDDGNPTQGGDSATPSPNGIPPTISWSYIYNSSGQAIGVDSWSQPVLWNRDYHARITTVSDILIHQTVQFVSNSPNVLKITYAYDHKGNDSHNITPDGRPNSITVVSVGFWKPSALGLDSGWVPQFACPNSALSQVTFNPFARFNSPQNWAGFTNSSNSFGPSQSSSTTNAFFFQRDTSNPPQWFFVQSLMENMSLSGAGIFYSTSEYVILANIHDAQQYICSNPL